MTPEEEAAKAASDAAAAEAAKAKSDAEAAANNKEKKTYDAEYVERLRREKADAERTAKEHAAKVAAYEKAQADNEAKAAAEQGKYKELYEKERQAREADVTASKARLLNAELKARAAAAGMQDPSDALSLIDHSKVTINDAGDVTDTASLFEALKVSKPYLFKVTSAPAPGSPPAPAPGGGAPAPVPGGGAPVKQDAGKMSKADFDAAWSKAGRK